MNGPYGQLLTLIVSGTMLVSFCKPAPERSLNRAPQTPLVRSEPTTLPQATNVRTDPQSVLKSHIERLLALANGKHSRELETQVDELKLPHYKTWFTDTFGDKTGRALAADYGGSLKDMTPILISTFQDMAKQGQTDVNITGLEPTGVIKDAMRKPAELYVVRVVKPGEKAGSFLMFFVQSGGNFRFVGPLEPIWKHS